MISFWGIFPYPHHISFISKTGLLVLEVVFRAPTNNKFDLFKVRSLYNGTQKRKFNNFFLFDLLELHLWEEVAVREFQNWLSKLGKMFAASARSMHGISSTFCRECAESELDFNNSIIQELDSN